MQRAPLLLILSALFVTTACLVTRVSSWDRIKGRSWTLVEIEGKAPLPEAPITLKLEDPNQLFGASGVNSYFGSYEPGAGDTFRAGQVAGTRMAGPEPLMQQESRYLELLLRANRIRYQKTGESARLALAEDEVTLLVFAPTR